MGAFEDSVYENIAKEIVAERKRQVEELGYDDIHDSMHEPTFFTALIHGYVGKASDASILGKSREDWDRNLIKAAALCIAAIEAAEFNDWGD